MPHRLKMFTLKYLTNISKTNSHSFEGNVIVSKHFYSAKFVKAQTT